MDKATIASEFAINYDLLNEGIRAATLFDRIVELGYDKCVINKCFFNQLGMTEMFRDDANFGELLDSSVPLKWSNVIHEAFIEIDEKGSGAGAIAGNYTFLVFYFFVPI